MKKKETKRLLKKLLFCNVPIEKLKIKKVNNVNMLRELPFYDELNIVQTAKAFLKYARSYSIDIMKDKNGNMNDSLAHLEASKSVIKDLFRGLLTELMGFKYQIH